MVFILRVKFVIYLFTILIIPLEKQMKGKEVFVKFKLKNVFIVKCINYLKKN